MTASSRVTRIVLTIGAIVSAACLTVAIILEILGQPQVAGDPLDPRAIFDALVAFRPWGWATIGILAVIVTPAAGLIATAREYHGSRESWLAMVVLGILTTSLVIALLR